MSAPAEQAAEVLRVVDLKKDFPMGDTVVHALRGISFETSATMRSRISSASS